MVFASDSTTNKDYWLSLISVCQDDCSLMIDSQDINILFALMENSRFVVVGKGVLSVLLYVL